MYKSSSDTKEKLIKRYSDLSDIGSTALKAMSEHVLSGWHDQNTQGGLAIYKLNKHFMHGHIPDANLIEDAIEGLQVCLKRWVKDTDNPSFEKKQLQNTIHNLKVILEGMAEELGANKEAAYKYALLGFSGQEKFTKNFKKYWDPIFKREGFKVNYKNGRGYLNVSVESAGGYLDAYFNFKSKTWEIKVGVLGKEKTPGSGGWEEPKKPEKSSGTFDPAEKITGTEFSWRIADILKYKSAKLNENFDLYREAGFQDMVDGFNSRFLKTDLMQSFKDEYDALFRELGVKFKYRAIVQKGKVYGFEAYFKGRTPRFPKAEIHIHADQKSKGLYLNYVLERNSPLSEGPGKKAPFNGSDKTNLVSSDFTNSNREFRRMADRLLNLLANPNKHVSPSFKV